MPYVGRAPPLAKKDIETLQQDTKDDNSRARDEDVTRRQLESAIAQAQIASRADRLDPEKLLVLVEAHGILDPRDKQCFNCAERLVKHVGVGSLPLLRQGDAHLLYGRGLFLRDDFEESVEEYDKARICYQSEGTRRKRKDANIGLLRAFCVLGKSKEASRRLEVGLTLCEEGKDDAVDIFMHAKNCLEKTSIDRDAEVLDDIWYVHLETHPEDKKKFEEYSNMATSTMRQLVTDDDDEHHMTFKKAVHDVIFEMNPMMKKFMLCMLMLAAWASVMLIVLKLKGA